MSAYDDNLLRPNAAGNLHLEIVDPSAANIKTEAANFVARLRQGGFDPLRRLNADGDTPASCGLQYLRLENGRPAEVRRAAWFHPDSTEPKVPCNFSAASKT